MEGRSSPGVYTLFRSSMCNEKQAVGGGLVLCTWGQPSPGLSVTENLEL